MPAYAIDAVIPVVDPTAFVHPAAVLIGDVVVGSGCYVGPGASLRGDMGRIRICSGAIATRSLASLHEVDPLPALPAERGELAISPERAMPLREFRQADRPLAAPGARAGVDSRSSAC